MWPAHRSEAPTLATVWRNPEDILRHETQTQKATAWTMVGNAENRIQGQEVLWGLERGAGLMAYSANILLGDGCPGNKRRWLCKKGRDWAQLPRTAGGD